jgi:hypothetical protein
MPKVFAVALSALAVATAVAPARAISLDDACARFASKLSDAVKSGDTAKAQEIYSIGSQRIASRFNGATCPNVQPPASSN